MRHLFQRRTVRFLSVCTCELGSLDGVLPILKGSTLRVTSSLDEGRFQAHTAELHQGFKILGPKPRMFLNRLGPAHAPSCLRLRPVAGFQDIRILFMGGVSLKFGMGGLVAGFPVIWVWGL